MKLTRSQKREGTFLLLYQSTLNDDTLDEIVEANISEFEMLIEEDDEVVVSSAKAAADYAEKADEIINRYSPTRKVSRIPYIPLAIMRLGTLRGGVRINANIAVYPKKRGT
jgi:transcription termination factor NusB